MRFAYTTEDYSVATGPRVIHFTLKRWVVFILQAMTWLNRPRRSDHAAAAALVELVGPEIKIEAAVQMFAKIGRWSRHAGPEPARAGQTRLRRWLRRGILRSALAREGWWARQESNL